MPISQRTDLKTKRSVRLYGRVATERLSQILLHKDFSATAHTYPFSIIILHNKSYQKNLELLTAGAILGYPRRSFA